MTSDPWLLELVVVRDGSHGGSERRSLSRDVERGLLVRVRQGVYVEAAARTAATAEQRHVIRMRALGAVSPEVPAFSHVSAAVALGLPVDAARLAKLHVSGGGAALTGRKGVSGHLRPVPRDDVVAVGELLVTTPARTVVDIAGSAGFDDAVMAADAALFRGLPRAELERAVEEAGDRRGAVRASGVVAFASPGGESANESRSRCTMYRLGVEPPRLQHVFVDDRGFIASVDDWWEHVRGVGEADGAAKYLDPRLATRGAGRAVHEEKLREDRIRLQCRGFARWGWAQSCSGPLLRPILARIGVVPLRNRPTLEDWAAIAAEARPRRHASFDAQRQM